MANKDNWYREKDIWNDPVKRFEVIRKAFELEGSLPGWGSADSESFTKMLFENRQVYCSEAAWELIWGSGGKGGFNDDELARLESGEVQDSYLQNKVHQFKKKTGTRLIWEHVVPVSRVIGILRTDCRYGLYERLLRLGVLCIVTEEEDGRLTGEGLSKRMPEDWTFDPSMELTDDIIWARYIRCGISVHNLFRFEGEALRWLRKP